MATAPSRDRRDPPAPNALGCYLLEQAGKRSGPPTTGSARPEMIRPSTVAEYVSHEQHDGSTQERDRVGARSNRKERRPYLPWPLLTEAGSRARALGRGRNAWRGGVDGVRPRPCSSPLLILWEGAGRGGARRVIGEAVKGKSEDYPIELIADSRRYTPANR